MVKKITFNVPNLRYGLCVALVCLLGAFAAAQTPAPPAAAKAAMDAGLQHLKDARWQQANQSFDLVLMFAQDYAPAHFGKLCAALQVTEATIRDEWKVAIDDHALFKAALGHADPAYKRLLEGYAAKVNERIAAERANIPADAHKPGDSQELTINGIQYTFRRIPAGWFMMGSPADERGRSSDESQRQVTLSKGFWMLETEVTQGMWMSVMGNNPSSNKGLNLPVTNVSWNDCQEFITKLNALLAGTPGAPAGYKFSLPTEAQWEYACRAGTTTAYHFGDTLTQQQANFNSHETKDVGSYPSNAWGLKDMHGNVWEWCQDIYGNYPSGAVTDPTGAGRGSRRVLRGGCWRDRAQACRSAHRGDYDPTGGNDFIGLRLSLVFESR